jgi:hypothetical protein
VSSATANCCHDDRNALSCGRPSPDVRAGAYVF